MLIGPGGERRGKEGMGGARQDEITRIQGESVCVGGRPMEGRTGLRRVAEYKKSGVAGAYGVCSIQMADLNVTG